jgi:hypothetical protein
MPAAASLLAPHASIAFAARQDPLGLSQRRARKMSGLFSGLLGLCWLAFIILVIASLWVVFTKAGKPGWAAIVPIYNVIVMLEIVGKPMWWILLLLIPLVNIVIAIMLAIEMAKSFGKGTGFGIGLALLPFIFYPILAFGAATYQHPS